MAASTTRKRLAVVCFPVDHGRQQRARRAHNRPSRFEQQMHIQALQRRRVTACAYRVTEAANSRRLGLS